MLAFWAATAAFGGCRNGLCGINGKPGEQWDARSSLVFALGVFALGVWFWLLTYLRIAFFVVCVWGVSYIYYLFVLCFGFVFIVFGAGERGREGGREGGREAWCFVFYLCFLFIATEVLFECRWSVSRGVRVSRLLLLIPRFD